MQTDKPKAKYRLGTCCLTCWNNISAKAEDFETYTLDVNYFDKESGTYKEAKSMSMRQLLQLRIIIEKALMDSVGNK